MGAARSKEGEDGRRRMRVYPSCLSASDAGGYDRRLALLIL